MGAAVIGAGVQHYLIEAAESPQHGVRLESSDFVFDNLPALLAHYCQCCDELPVRLKLPAKIRTSPDRHSLTSLALLGTLDFPILPFLIDGGVLLQQCQISNGFRSCASAKKEKNMCLWARRQ